MNKSFLSIEQHDVTTDLETSSLAISRANEMRSMGRLEDSVREVKYAIVSLRKALTMLENLSLSERLAAIENNPLSIVFGSKHSTITFDSSKVKEILSKSGDFKGSVSRAAIGLLLNDFLVGGEGLTLVNLIELLKVTSKFEVHSALSQKNWKLEGFRLLTPGHGVRNGVYRLVQTESEPAIVG